MTAVPRLVDYAHVQTQPHLKEVTTDQRLARAERILLLIVNAGRRERKRMREMGEKIAILIDVQIRNEEVFRELRELRKESDRKWRENEIRWQDNQLRWQETMRKMQETDRQWREMISKKEGNGSSLA